MNVEKNNTQVVPTSEETAGSVSSRKEITGTGSISGQESDALLGDVRRKLKIATNLQEDLTAELNRIEQGRAMERSDKEFAAAQAQEEETHAFLRKEGIKTSEQREPAHSPTRLAENMSPNTQGDNSASKEKGLLRQFFHSPLGRKLRPLGLAAAASLQAACATTDMAYIGGEYTKDLIYGAAYSAQRQGYQDSEFNTQLSRDQANAAYQDQVRQLDYQRAMNDLTLSHEYALKEAQLEADRTGRPLEFREDLWEDRKQELELKYRYGESRQNLDQKNLVKERLIDRQNQLLQEDIARKARIQNSTNNAISRVIDSAVRGVINGFQRR